jgi:hypothetical protein
MAPSAIGVSGFFALAPAIPVTTVTVRRRLTDLHGLDRLLTHRSITSSPSIPCRLSCSIARRSACAARR